MEGYKAEVEGELLEKLAFQIWSAYNHLLFAVGSSKTYKDPKKRLEKILTRVYKKNRDKKEIPTLSIASHKRQRSFCRRHGRWRCHPFLWVVRHDGAGWRVHRLDMR